MKGYSKDDIRRICKEENIRYIRMMFTDMMGMLKNVEIPATRLEDALDNAVMIDGSSIEGFVRIYEADMFLHPDLNTFLVAVLITGFNPVIGIDGYIFTFLTNIFNRPPHLLLIHLQM